MKATEAPTVEEAMEFANIAGESEPWRDVLPLQRPVAPGDPAPIDALGKILGPAARAIRETVQCPHGLVMQSLLAAASYTVQPYADLEIDGRKCPVCLYLISIALSGERKDGVDQLTGRPHREHEASLCDEFEGKKRRYEFEIEVYRKAKEHASKAKKNAIDRMQALENLGEPPEQPLSPITMFGDMTWEGYCNLAQHSLPSHFLTTTEGGLFSEGHSMSDENQVKTAAGLSGIYDSGVLDRIRRGDGVVKLRGRRLSIHLAMQPGVAMHLLSNSRLRDQGFLYRLLVSWPESTAGSRLYREKDGSLDPAIQSYYAQVHRVLSTPMPLANARANELSPRVITLSPVAKKLYIKFHDAIEKRLAPDGELEAVRAFASKAPTHAARIAAVLSLFEDIHCSNVSEQHMASAITITQYYLNEALRLFNAGVNDPVLVDAEKLLRWLHKRKDKETGIVTLTEITQCGPTATRTAATARKLMAILTSHGLVRVLPGGAFYADKPRREAWEVRAENEI
jgi:uncharacterized protein DUF3987